jgi:small nuclear ribonucleoprotein (snRNP)-like protein|tara:strand:- start:783 stop:965 length:183 start_codon:yes stop_codon:yes gene_type:complete
MMEGWKNYEGKRIFVKLKNGREYSGTVIEVNTEWMAIKDKFGKNVTIRRDDISVLEEENK